MSKKGGRKGHLTKILESHIQNIQETFQMLDKPASSSLDKVDWSEVIKLGDEVSKQATIAGLLWNGEAREVKELEENMAAYFNVLQGFLLTCHGSTVGAGHTLHENVRDSAKQVVDCSHSLLREAVSIYDSHNPSKRLTIPQLSGSVWEACAALKKTPTTNRTAIVRAITRVAVSVKDVLREMKELKLLTDDLDDGDIGEDLSPEEMTVARLVINVTFNSLDALKEVIRFVSGLLDNEDFVESLERVLAYCKEIGSQVSELGACVYPPQEISEMKAVVKEIRLGVGGIRGEVEEVEGSKERLFVAFRGVETALGELESGLDGDLVSEMDKVAL